MYIVMQRQKYEKVTIYHYTKMQYLMNLNIFKFISDFGIKKFLIIYLVQYSRYLKKISNLLSTYLNIIKNQLI